MPKPPAVTAGGRRLKSQGRLPAAAERERYAASGSNRGCASRRYLTMEHASDEPEPSTLMYLFEGGGHG